MPVTGASGSNPPSATISISAGQVTGFAQAAQADPVVELTAALQAASSALAVATATYVPISSLKETITYNADGTVATVTETASGAVTTYTYNADGTPATESRVLNGVTTARTFAYSGGNLVGVS